jgi:hypothetical protein
VTTTTSSSSLLLQCSNTAVATNGHAQRRTKPCISTCTPHPENHFRRRPHTGTSETTTTAMPSSPRWCIQCTIAPYHHQLRWQTRQRRHHRSPCHLCTTLEHPPLPTPAPFPIPTPIPTPSTPAKVNGHVIQNHVTYNRFSSCCCDSNAGSLSTQFFLHSYICGLMLPLCIFAPGISLNKI